MTTAPSDRATILTRWSCYVDGITETHVELVMKDNAVDDPDEEIGTFPRHLLAHLEYGRGTYLTVTVRDDRTLTIERTPESYGPSAGLHLADLLRRARFD